MPQQLIYTSAPRGVVAGRSGHCTVARSAAMREALMLQLEKLSYYQHLSLSGGKERAIYSCRAVDIRSSRYHVLTRIQDAGLDFTGRTNFLAHHLIFTPEEIRQFPSPPVILREWPGWLRSWSKDPELLENENWSALNKLSSSVSIPATTWEQVTGDAVNGYSLLESRAGIAFRVDNIPEEQMLALFAESLELLELRDPRRDFRSTAWQYTFTTSMQEQDNPADFRWRCLHSDNPAANRFAGPDCRPLSEMRARRVTSEETLFARSGRQPPRFVIQPQDVRSTEGEPARLHAKAEGVPSPSYQWFAVDRIGNGQVIATGTDAELVVQNPPIGVSRYVVRASNSQGEVTSAAATLSVERKLRLSQTRPASDASSPVKPARPSYVKSADDIDRQRRRIEAEQAQVMFQRNLRVRKVLAIVAVVFGVAVLAVAFWSKRSQPQPNVSSSNGIDSSNTIRDPVIPATSTPGNSAGITAKSQLKEDDQEVIHTQGKSGSMTSKTDSSEFKLPEGWMQIPIGNVSYGHVDFITNMPVKFVLSAAAEGFRTNGDSLFFVCRTNGPGGFQTSLITMNNDPPLSQNSVRGIMVRDAEGPTASFLFIGASSQKIYGYRRNVGGELFMTNAPIEGASIILKFEQQKDNQLVAAYSFDHQKWIPFQNFAFSIRTQFLVGFAVSSGDPSNRVAGRFVVLPPKGDSRQANDNRATPQK
jgi:hypothetical protein